ncbi:MAG: ABC-2 transporter permease [Clostridia bacterium]|nr:ABC-2 transporter permease [Clostridia bacterium]
MRVLSLLKKDVYLTKKYLLVILGIAILFPVFIFYKATPLSGLTSFLITAIFSVYMALQAVSLSETKYPKATALLCTTPYLRKNLVIAKYLFFAGIIFIVALFYQGIAFVLPEFKFLTINQFLTALVVESLLLGIYLPLEYKLGYEKMKYLLMVVVMITPFVLPYIMQWLNSINWDFSFYLNLSNLLRAIICIVITTIVATISIIISVHIFKAKDL